MFGALGNFFAFKGTFQAEVRERRLFPGDGDEENKMLACGVYLGGAGGDVPVFPRRSMHGGERDWPRTRRDARRHILPSVG